MSGLAVSSRRWCEAGLPLAVIDGLEAKAEVSAARRDQAKVAKANPASRAGAVQQAKPEVSKHVK